MAGVEQHLGTQLDNQAQSMGDLVTKMTEMISKQDQAIDKYVVLSDVVRTSKNEETSKLGTTSDIGLVNTTYKCYVNGEIRIKYEIQYPSVNSSAPATHYPRMEYRHNGIFYPGPYYSSTQAVDLTATPDVWHDGYIELIVEEGDLIEIGHDGDSKMRNVRICYDEVIKPGGIIT